jgi:hypothetical protein
MGDHKEKPGENKVQDDASFAEGRIQALPLNNAVWCAAFTTRSDGRRIAAFRPLDDGDRRKR